MTRAVSGSRPGEALRIGLTGGIASGKSTVAALFADRGVPVIDTDQVARQVVAPGSPGLREVAGLFGPGVLDAGGALDRAALRDRVFADPEARRQLESILHPMIIAEAERQMSRAGGPYQVIVAPLLVEAGLTGWVDRVLVVDCPVEIQLDRLLARDGGSEGQARSILSAQATREARLAAADDVIENDGSREKLLGAVENLDRAYREIARDRVSAAADTRLP